MLELLYWRLQRLLGRGRGRVISDDGPVQLVQVEFSTLETRDGLPHMQHYGFQSFAPDGFGAVVSFLGGERTAGVVTATVHQKYRFKPLKKGEVCISDDKGQSIYLSASGITINGGSLPITVNNAASVTVNDCNVNVQNGDVIANGISLLNHVHSGVTPGGATTGTPVT